jgi:hypothetical protein
MVYLTSQRVPALMRVLRIPLHCRGSRPFCMSGTVHKTDGPRQQRGPGMVRRGATAIAIWCQIYPTSRTLPHAAVKRGPSTKRWFARPHRRFQQRGDLASCEATCCWKYSNPGSQRQRAVASRQVDSAKVPSRHLSLGVTLFTARDVMQFVQPQGPRS